MCSTYDISWVTIFQLFRYLGDTEYVGTFVCSNCTTIVHISLGKGAAVFVDELSAAVDSGMGTMTNIFGSKHCLNYKCRGVT